MLELLPDRPASRPSRILCLGAHSDDIEIGCAGTLMRLLEAEPQCSLRWIVFSANEERAREATESAERLGGDSLISVKVLGFRDGYFPDQWADLKDTFRDLERELSPDLIFTHRRADRHQDHRAVGDLTWQTFRNHLILEYEIPKYEGDLNRPNVYVQLSKDKVARKSDHLMGMFPSQQDKSWFTKETFMGLARTRGIECGSGCRYAEAFHGSKIVFAP